MIKKNNKINDHHIDLLSKSYNFPQLRELELIDCSKLSDKSIVSLLTQKTMSNLDPNSFLKSNIRNVKKLSDISDNFKKHE